MSEQAVRRTLSDSRDFPEEFLIGASTSAHQTEGNNTNSDWWDFENHPNSIVAEPSLDACDSYHRFRDDIRVAHDFGLNAYRFSIEWSRIEPAEGHFSRAELAHYRDMILTCREFGLTPVVTFHHFALPRWLGPEGGYLSPRFAQLFERYCDRTAQAIGDLLTWACTINEPEGAGDAGWVVGVHPPGVKGDHESMWQVVENVVAAHQRGASAIRRHSDTKVGVTLAFQDMQYEDDAAPGHTEWENNARVSERFIEESADDDFIGLQTYTRIRFGPEGQRGPGLKPEDKNSTEESDHTTMVGWELYPEALAGTIRRTATVSGGKPILLTENGVATVNDEKRIHFIDRALRSVRGCLEDGIDVRGYLYWSLLDNYEWSAGFRPRFGLCEVDRETFERRPKPSGYWLGQVARTGRLPQELTRWP